MSSFLASPGPAACRLFSLARARSLLVPMLCASLGLTACGAGDNDYAVIVSYVVNGLAPTSEECALQGIKLVRLSIDSGTRTRTLESECGESSIFLDDGYEYGGFRTNQWFEYGVLYRYELEMIGVNGEVLIPGSGTFVADYGNVTPVILPTLDFFAPRTPGGEIATVTGAFSVGETPDLAQACADAGINRVELWVYSVFDEAGEYYDRVLYTPCDAGTLDSGTPLLNRGDYWISYVALNYTSEAQFVVVEESEAIPVQVLEPGNVALPPHQFTGP